MSRKKSTWFGIRLSQKQATQVVIISFVGIFFLTLTTVPALTSLFLSLREAIVYDDWDWFIEYSLWYNLPFLCIMMVFLVLAISSLLRSRRVAISYSDIIQPQITESETLKFCPNCGNERTSIEKFCRACGEELR